MLEKVEVARSRKSGSSDLLPDETVSAPCGGDALAALHMKRRNEDNTYDSLQSLHFCFTHSCTAYAEPQRYDEAKTQLNHTSLVLLRQSTTCVYGVHCEDSMQNFCDQETPMSAPWTAASPVSWRC